VILSEFCSADKPRKTSFDTISNRDGLTDGVTDRGQTDVQ